MSRVIGRGIGAAAIAALFVSGCSGQPSVESKRTAPETPAAHAVGAPTHMVVGKAPAAIGGMPSIVILSPQTPREFPQPAEKPFMDQVTLTFTPAFLFVRTGQPTEFRNSDDVLHNVRVREEATRQGTFNVAIPTGGTYVHTFERDGFYDVGCDIHPGMSAQIFSASTPHVAMADLDGSFIFENVEPGAYRVTIYTGTDTIERAIDVSGPRTDVGL